MEAVLQIFTLKERHLSRTNNYLSLSIKIAIFTFFNSAIVPLISKEIIVKKRVHYDHNIDRNNLLVNDMLVLFLVNAIVTPIFWTINLKYYFKQFLIRRIEKEKVPDKSHYMTQKELNKLYELPDMNIAYKYAYIAKTMAMTLFYLPIFPMGFIISFIGLVLGYILELYNFTHLYKRPEMIDEIITKVYADYFIIIIFIGSIGDIFFFYDIFPNDKISIASIIIFGVLIFIPYTKFIDCNFVGINKSDFYDFPLSDVYFTFYSDYQRQNPFTKKSGLLNYLTELKNRGYLSENAYELAKENIDKINIMEIYYEITRGNMPIMHQSAISNANNNRVISGPNLKQSVIIPSINDNLREKEEKQKYFDSQILKMFGTKISKKINYPINFPMDTIIEEDEDYQNKLINAYNNPPCINMGLGPLPMEDNFKNIPISKSLTRNASIHKSISNSKDKNNLNFPYNLNEEEKNNYINNINNSNIRREKSKDSHIGLKDNKKSITFSKLDEKEEEKSMSINNFNMGQNQNNKSKNDITLSLDDLDKDSEEKNIDMPYCSTLAQDQNSININTKINLNSMNKDTEEKNTDMPYCSTMAQGQNDININQDSNIKENYENEVPIPRDTTIHNINDSSNDNKIDNYNNNSMDNENNTQLKNLNNEFNNDTHSFNEDNLNNMFKNSFKKDENDSNTKLIQDTTTKKEIISKDDELVKDISITNNDINFDNITEIDKSQEVNNNNEAENNDIVDANIFPDDNQNNENKNNEFNNEEAKDVNLNNNKKNKSNLSDNISNNSELDDNL